MMDLVPLTEESEPVVTRYRGKHRAPNLVDTVVDNSGRAAAAVVTTGILATVPTLVSAPVASAATGNLDAIAFCESTNNPRANGPITEAGGHYGLFQFDLATWRSVGGKGNPRDASVDEQYKRAAMLMDSRGTQPWNASKDCWQGKSGVRKVETHKTEGKRSSGRVADQSDKGKRRADTSIPDGYVVKSGDTLGKLAKRFGVEGGSSAIAKANGIANPDLIFVGQTLK